MFWKAAWYFTFSFLLLFGCNRKDSPEFVTVSGKIINNATDRLEVKAWNYVALRQETVGFLNLDSTGAFSSQFALTQPKHFFISANDLNTVILFAQPAGSLQVEADAQRMSETLSIQENNPINDIGRELREKVNISDFPFRTTQERFIAYVDSIEVAARQAIDSVNSVHAFSRTELEYLSTSVQSSIMYGSELYARFNKLEGDSARQLFSRFEGYAPISYLYLVNDGPWNTPLTTLYRTTEDEVSRKGFLEFMANYTEDSLVLDYMRGRYVFRELDGMEDASFDSLMLYLEELGTNSVTVSTLEQRRALLKRLDPGNIAPNIVGFDVNGEERLLQEFQGKLVVVEVWTTWCPYCAQEKTPMEAIVSEFSGNKDIVFLRVSVDEDVLSWKEHINEERVHTNTIEINIREGYNSELFSDYGLTGVPGYLVVDPQGYIVTIDAPRPSSGRLKEYLESLLTNSEENN